MANLAQLLDPKTLGKVTIGIQAVITESVQKDGYRLDEGLPGRPLPLAEVKRRFELCVKIFCILRGDMKWGFERALGKMPEYLRCELDGKPWEPDARTIWTPGVGG